MTQFTKYGSIENHYKERTINKIRSRGLDSGTFVALEKIHGANFSFWYNPSIGVKQAKRSSFIGEDTFFSNHKIAHFEPKVIEVYKRMLEDCTICETDTIVVVGEIFGGNFFGEKEEGSATVQGGMNYVAGTEFMAFDIKVVCPEGSFYLGYSKMVQSLADLIPVAPVVTEGTFEEVLAYDNNFSSLVPAYYGLKAPNGEHIQSEGFVMRPKYEERANQVGERVILKSKNDKFSEVAPKAKAAKPKVVLSEVATNTYIAFSLYLTEQRLNNVISKEGEVTWKDFAKLSGLLFQDAVAEYNGFYSVDLKADLDGEWKQFTKESQAVCQQIVREYLKLNA